MSTIVWDGDTDNAFDTDANHAWADQDAYCFSGPGRQSGGYPDANVNTNRYPDSDINVNTDHDSDSDVNVHTNLDPDSDADEHSSSYAHANSHGH